MAFKFLDRCYNDAIVALNLRMEPEKMTNILNIVLIVNAIPKRIKSKDPR